MKKFLILSFLIIVSSCGPSARQRYEMNSQNSAGLYQNSTTNNLNNSGNSQICNCTYNFQPVCGSDQVTYENSCFANCKGVSFVAGACNSSQNSNQCNINSGPVCGMPKGTSIYKNYINECEIYKDNAVLMNFGNCR